MHLRQRRLLGQLQVLQHRVAPVNGVAEQGAFPEIADDGQVGFEVELGYFGEDVAHGLVRDRFGVEVFDKHSQGDRLCSRVKTAC
jgi:hypothetical protein